MFPRGGKTAELIFGNVGKLGFSVTANFSLPSATFLKTATTKSLFSFLLLLIPKVFLPTMLNLETLIAVVSTCVGEILLFALYYG